MLTIGCLSAAKIIHQILLESVLHLPMSFFDTNPLGRILLRFSKDVECVDDSLRWGFSDLTLYSFEVIRILLHKTINYG